MKHRTLIFSFPFASAMGGGERYLERLVAGLSPRGFDFTLVSSSRALLTTFWRHGWEARPIWGGIEPVSKSALGLFLITLPFFLPIHLGILAYFRIFRGARRLICLSLTDKLLATAPARIFGLKVIWLEHLIPGRSLIQNPYRFPLMLLSRLARVVTVSQAAAKGFSRLGYHRGGMDIIPPGLSEDETLADGPSEKLVVGVVSRLSKEKNLDMLIRAFSRAAEKIPAAELRVFGDGPERQALEASVAKLAMGHRVVWHGHIERRADIFQGLRLLAVPSTRESFGLSALEAQGRGLPVLASNVGGLPEVVEDGRTGRLLPPEDEEAWSGALLELLSDIDLCRRLGFAGHARAMRLFSLEKTLAAWEGLLRHDTRSHT
jgi:glycosyltransferase involved in cell wall biosynthesis